MTDLIRKSDALDVVRRIQQGYSDVPENWCEAIVALPAVVVGVRKLVWEAGERDQRRADSILGEFCVTFFGGRWFYQGEPRKGMLDAQAAAQADYEARILAALKPVAAPVTQDKFSAVDHMSRVADTWMHKAEGLQREIDMLTDPVTVHANMLRGTIAKPTVEQIIHLYGVDALTKALAPVIVRDAAPYMTDLMVDPEEIFDMEMEYDHRAGASDDE